MYHSNREQILDYARQQSIFTAREASKMGIHSQLLTRLVREGTLERIARGQYRLPDQQLTEHFSLAVVAQAVPSGVICLLSALSFHGIGTQLPADVWLAIDRRARWPRLDYPRLRVVRFSGEAFTAGIETHTVEGQTVKVYGIAKTLADLFKYRNKVGLDVVLEALRETWYENRFTIDEIDRYARICRVQRVMTPYLEALVS